MVYFAEMNEYSFGCFRGLLDNKEFYYFFRVVERVIDRDKRLTKVYIFWSKDVTKLSEKMNQLKAKYPDGLFTCNFISDFAPSPTPESDPNKDLPF